MALYLIGKKNRETTGLIQTKCIKSKAPPCLCIVTTQLDNSPLQLDNGVIRLTSHTLPIFAVSR